MVLEEQKLIDYIKQKVPELQMLYLFGSYAKGNQTEKSDLDLAFSCGKKLNNLQRWELAEDIAAFIDCDVDLIDLMATSTVMAYQVVTTGKLLYSVNNQEDWFVMTTMSMYQHLQEERRTIINDYFESNLK